MQTTLAQFRNIINNMNKKNMAIKSRPKLVRVEDLFWIETTQYSEMVIPKKVYKPRILCRGDAKVIYKISKYRLKLKNGEVILKVITTPKKGLLLEDLDEFTIIKEKRIKNV